MNTRSHAQIAIILAGGSGARMGLDYPKQFSKIAGKTVLEHTLDVFAQSAAVEEILVVSSHNFVDHVLRITSSPAYAKVRKVISGGATRADSTRAAIDALESYSPDTRVLFHDAVRPLLAEEIIDRIYAALDTAEAVDVVIPSADTIVQVDSAGYVAEMPDRTFMMRGQTPQGFHLDTIRRAYEALRRTPINATCDCGVVFRLLPEVRIATVIGSPENVKVTVPIDLHIADKLFQLRSHNAPKFLSSAAVCLEGRTVVVFGGNSGIGSAIQDRAQELGAHVFTYSRGTTGTDISSPESVELALKDAISRGGQIDYVINSAAILMRQPLVNMRQEDVEAMVRANFLGPLNIARQSHPHLARTRGSLLLFSSSSYTRGRAFYSIYSASKAAMVNLTQGLADEWAADGIRVNCISPERTATPMRTATFGQEPVETLLSAESVAEISLSTMLSQRSGQVIDIRIGD